jgi:nucleotide-binding universal stress UspA family protein
VLGSVADEVLHSAPVPLLLVRASAETAPSPPVAGSPYQRILVPLDGSPLAEQALPWVRQIAAEALAQVVLLTVLPPPGTGPAPPPAVAVAQAGSAETYLGEIKARMTAPGVQVTMRVTHGDPATEIGRVTEEVGADLIVMATHGRTGLPRLRLGSVATKVVQASAAPILLVRAQEPAGS